MDRIDGFTSGLKDSVTYGLINPLQSLLADSPFWLTGIALLLLAWLLHHGRREDVAEALHVHPQTVRYRLGTLREHYGDALTDVRTGLELTLGLLADRSRTLQ